jgi:hypothetical protein
VTGVERQGRPMQWATRSWVGNPNLGSREVCAVGSQVNEGDRQVLGGGW